MRRDRYYYHGRWFCFRTSSPQSSSGNTQAGRHSPSAPTGLYLQRHSGITQSTHVYAQPSSIQSSIPPPEHPYPRYRGGIPKQPSQKNHPRCGYPSQYCLVFCCCNAKVASKFWLGRWLADWQADKGTRIFKFYLTCIHIIHKTWSAIKDTVDNICMHAKLHAYNHLELNSKRRE